MIPGQASTRDRLIAAAVSLFQARGYHGVGLTEILAEAKAPKGSLYHHFPDGKSQLAEAAIGWLCDEITGHLDRATASDASSPQVMAGIVKGIGQWLQQHEWRQGALLAILGQEVASGEERVARAVAQAYEAVLAAFCRLLSRDGPQSARGDAVAIIAMLDGAVALCRATRSTQPLDDIAAAIDKLLKA